MNSLRVGVESWIIQDGNYPDFRAGQEARFAMQFGPNPQPAHGAGAPSLNYLAGAMYDATGRIVFTAADAWVCDFGVLAYTAGEPPSGTTVGSCVAGEIYLSIDPFDYFETFCKLPGMPSLFYNFSIRHIWLETTPWVEDVDASGRRFTRRQHGGPSFREVQQTDAWKDDGGFAHYVLECEHLGRAV